MNSFSSLICQNGSFNCPGGTDYLLEGRQNVNQKTVAPGPSTLACMISLHVQGIVEPKVYLRCSIHFGQPDEGWASGPVTGDAGAGCYPNTAGNASVYMIQIGGDSDGQRYFFNALNHFEAQFTYPIDYVSPPFLVRGGDPIWFLADDSNCSITRNCDSTSTDLPSPVCHQSVVTDLPSSSGITQPYDGQFIYLRVASVTPM